MMSDQLVERVATAISNADLDGPDPDDYWDCLARAAIAAMSPTLEAAKGLAVALEEARIALERAEMWFDHYANLHIAKGTSDGDQKAATNKAKSMEMGEAADAARSALTKWKEASCA